MSGPLNLTHLRSLTAVIDHDGFTRAARALHLSQSTVSQHIYLLEQRLATSLLVRDHHGLTLTTAGERLLADARDLLAAHDALLQRFAPQDRPALNVGSTEHATEQLLLRLLTGFRQGFPDHRVFISLNRSPELVAAVAADRLDLAFTLAVGSPTRPAADPTSLIGRLPLRWLAAQSQPVPELGRPIALVAYDGACGIRERALALLRRAGLDAEIAVEATTLDGMVTAARAGLGIALLPIASTPPAGLVEQAGLPEAGTVELRCIARRGLDPQVEETAAAVARTALQHVHDDLRAD